MIGEVVAAADPMEQGTQDLRGDWELLVLGASATSMSTLDGSHGKGKERVGIGRAGKPMKVVEVSNGCQVDLYGLRVQAEAVEVGCKQRDTCPCGWEERVT